jgi:circadian clock protein KaiB
MMSAPDLAGFRLYVAGDAQNSTVAMNNLTALCREHLDGRHEIEVIDVFEDPQRALDDGIMMTPTVVRVDLTPMRKVVGNLSESAWVVHALGLAKRIA